VRNVGSAMNILNRGAGPRTEWLIPFLYSYGLMAKRETYTVYLSMNHINRVHSAKGNHTHRTHLQKEESHTLGS